jgi:lipopolysaccharide transport system permease protein
LFLVNKHYRDIIFFKAGIHLRSEASRTYLSFLWWALDPLIALAIYYVVFGVIFQRSTPHFVPFLLIGLVTWQWFANTISHCMESVNGNTALISQINFPKIILPGVNIVIDAFKFAVIFLILLAFLWIYGFHPTIHYVALLPILLAQYLFNSMSANIAALAVPIVPDLKLIMSNLLRVGMYASGILYEFRSLPEKLHVWFHYNPMAQLIEFYRDVLMRQQWPDFHALGIIIGCGLLGLIATSKLFSLLDPKLPRLLLEK